MHPRNPYRTPPDFGVLAEAYPELRQLYVVRLFTTEYVNNLKHQFETDFNRDDY